MQKHLDDYSRWLSPYPQSDLVLQVPPFDQPPRFEIAALKAIVENLETDFFSPAIAHPALAGPVPIEDLKEIRGLEEQAIREAMKRLRELARERKPTHSADFTSVDWFGTAYSFTKGLQAASVKALWEAWEAGTPNLSQESIGEMAGSANERFRLEHVFKPTNRKVGRKKANENHTPHGGR